MTTTTAWTEISRETTTMPTPCGYFDDCPCCTCGEDGTVRVEQMRLRYSRSRKRHVPETVAYTLCPAHASETIY